MHSRCSRSQFTCMAAARVFWRGVSSATSSMQLDNNTFLPDHNAFAARFVFDNRVPILALVTFQQSDAMSQGGNHLFRRFHGNGIGHQSDLLCVSPVVVVASLLANREE